MANRTPQSVSEALQKFFTVQLNTRIACRRVYDQWVLKQIWADKKRRALTRFQKFNSAAHRELGSDLAVSKFAISYCDGEVRDQRGIWIKRSKDLPPDYSNSFKVTALQVARSGLLTEAIDNFVGLDYLESLDLSSNPKLDDFACDQLSRQFRKSATLREIDLSNNPLISIYGLEILFRIPSIRKIIAIGTQAAEHEEIDLFTLAAEDERQCEVLVNSEKYYKLPELEAQGTQTSLKQT